MQSAKRHLMELPHASWSDLEARPKSPTEGAIKEGVEKGPPCLLTPAPSPPVRLLLYRNPRHSLSHTQYAEPTSAQHGASSGANLAPIPAKPSIAQHLAAIPRGVP